MYSDKDQTFFFPTSWLKIRIAKVDLKLIFSAFFTICLEEDSGFSSWSLWSSCTKTCTDVQTPAVKSRHRLCARPPCSGSAHQEKACNLPQCPGLTVTVPSPGQFWQVSLRTNPTFYIFLFIVIFLNAAIIKKQRAWLVPKKTDLFGKTVTEALFTLSQVRTTNVNISLGDLCYRPTE